MAPARTAPVIPRLARADIDRHLGPLEADAWPPRHRAHKYWGRKPAGLVAAYLEFFSRPGELILDPFAGSAVTLVEAARAGRRARGFDLNPFAVRLGCALLAPPTPEKFAAAAARVTGSLAREDAELYLTQCRLCRGPARVRSLAYFGTLPREVRYACTRCGKGDTAPPSRQDVERAQVTCTAPPSTPDGPMHFGWEMRKLQRRAVTRWSQLFTARNYRMAGCLLEEIEAEPDLVVREWLLLTLTASLAQFTRMIADGSPGAGGPSWKINCYWLPHAWQELNPLWYFTNRVKKSLAALRDLCHPPLRGAALYERADSRHLPLDDASVDYVFADPPYGGEGVQYGELSLLWCLFLRATPDLAKEIAFNPVRGLSHKDYQQGIADAFAEMHRVLAPGRWMTVTFANKDPQIWDGLRHACLRAGFRWVTELPVKRSAPSLTETTMKGAPKEDWILTFHKARRASRAKKPRLA